jgi:nucleoid-associated protein YgaU
MADATPDNQQLVQLRGKYDPAIRKMHELGIHTSKVEVQGGKLVIQADAPSEDAKNKAWDAIKKVDAGYKDLTANIRVSPGAGAGMGGPAGAAQPPGGRTYTVKSGDTLSKIAKEHYGNANQYNKIFEANKDQLTDADKIKPGQVLKIPN